MTLKLQRCAYDSATCLWLLEMWLHLWGVPQMALQPAAAVSHQCCCCSGSAAQPLSEEDYCCHLHPRACNASMATGCSAYLPTDRTGWESAGSSVLQVDQYINIACAPGGALDGGTAQHTRWLPCVSGAEGGGCPREREGGGGIRMEVVWSRG